MSRIVRVSEAASGLSARFTLLDELAPQHVDLLWKLAAPEYRYDAIHAMWTGPEISCPITADRFPMPLDIRQVSQENATSFPAMGDLALVCVPRGTWKGMPPQDFIDIGLFYGEGARLLMPMGWAMGSICAQVLPKDLANLQAGCRKIRQSGACQLVFTREQH